MGSILGPGDRLSLLSSHSVRPWASLEETRRCILCESVFDGAAIRIHSEQDASPMLQCPTEDCRSTPHDWVHPEDPLTSAVAWADWDRLIQQAENSQGELNP